MTPLPISPAPEEIRIESLSVDAHGIVIHARARRERIPCPECGRPATRVHSRYDRTLADLPWHDTAVRLRVQTRRFFCDEPDCERRIFAERLDRIAVEGRRLDYKSALQVRIQAERNVTPRYRTIEVAGPEHRREFTVEVLVDNERLGVGSGHSKQAAAQAAAQEALERLDRARG